MTYEGEYEQQYIALLKKCLHKGSLESNKRTGRQTLRLFGEHLMVERSDHLPLLLSRRLYIKTAAAEVAWTMTGEQSSAFISKYAKIWDKFAEKGKIESAYGYRWRRHFGRDQLNDAVRSLLKDPSSRQCVVMAWDASQDGLLNIGKSKNVPCPIGFQIVQDGQRLNLHVFQRSADLVLGTPYDMLFYCLLNCAIAKTMNLGPGKTMMSITDAHIYDYLCETAQKQINIYMENMSVISQRSSPMPISSLDMYQIEKTPDAYVFGIEMQAGYYQPFWTSPRLEPTL